MVRGNGFPMCDAGGSHFVSARIPAVRITQNVTNQDRQIRLKDIFIHNHPVAQFIISQVDQVLPIFGVMVHDLVGWIEGIINLSPQDLADLLICVLAVQSIRADQEDILLGDARFQAFFDQNGDSCLAMGILLEAALYPIGKTDRYFGTRTD